MRLTKIMKILIVVALFTLVAVPAFAGTWVYSGGNKAYCSPTGCIGVDKVHSTYNTYRDYDRYDRYDRSRDYRGYVRIDRDCDSGCKSNCKSNCGKTYTRVYNNVYDGYHDRYRYGGTYYRGVEYTYPYNHRVVRTGCPSYTTQRYSYW